ncbi:MAG: TIM barrel protein [Armatimonadota bacterium]|nr:MAG: TIM barrel protein [Armatimonadota bacterium]
MARFRLAINAGFAINRFPEPEVWLRIVGQELGVRCVQFVADLLNPFLPPVVVEEQLALLSEHADRNGVTIETAFTSAFTRVNHVLHPDPSVREAWVQWFEHFLGIARRLGARGVGSHFGILSVRDFEDDARRRERVEQGIAAWQRLSRRAADLGLEFLMFEPMSVPREMASTIPETRDLLERVNDGAAVPMLLCLDVDHGDVSHPNATDPYVWLREFAVHAPVVHIKQSKADKSGHWPFTTEHNKEGIITGPKVLEALEHGGATDVSLALELSHRERYPHEYRVLDDFRESVAYWRQYVSE